MTDHKLELIAWAVIAVFIIGISIYLQSAWVLLMLPLMLVLDEFCNAEIREREIMAETRRRKKI